MADKLVIVMANADPRNAAELLPPLSQATVAAAMEFEVEVIFTGKSGEILRRGVAESVKLDSRTQRSAYDMIREARDAGAKIKVCTSALAVWGGGDLLEEVDETVGSAYLISEAMDDSTVVFTY